MHWQYGQFVIVRQLRIVVDRGIGDRLVDIREERKNNNMKNNTLLMLGVAAVALYYFMSQQSSGGITQIKPNQYGNGEFPYGGYIMNGIYYEYDAQGVPHKVTA
jgi:hypothetical protein